MIKKLTCKDVEFEKKIEKWSLWKHIFPCENQQAVSGRIVESKKNFASLKP